MSKIGGVATWLTLVLDTFNDAAVGLASMIMNLERELCIFEKKIIINRLKPCLDPYYTIEQKIKSCNRHQDGSSAITSRMYTHSCSVQNLRKHHAPRKRQQRGKTRAFETRALDDFSYDFFHDLF